MKDLEEVGYLKDIDFKKIQLRVFHQCNSEVSYICIYFDSKYKGIVSREIDNILLFSGIHAIDISYFNDHIDVLLDENIDIKSNQ